MVILKRMKGMLPQFIALVLVLNLFSVQPVAGKTTDEYVKDLIELKELLQSQQLDGTVTEQELFENAMKAMAASYDKYTVFYNQEESVSFFNSVNNTYVGIGVSLEVKDGKAVVIEAFEGSAAYEAGIKANDIITGVEGEPIGYLKDNAALTPIIERIVGTEGTFVTVQFSRNGVAFEKKLERRLIVIKTVKPLAEKVKQYGASQALQDKTAAYQLTSFAEQSDEDLSVEIKKSIAAGDEYLILDMRNNGGGYLDTVIKMCQELLPAGKIVTLKDKNGGEYTATTTLTKAPFKIVLLVNEYSASATEIFAAALKDSGIGVIIGERTYGKGVAQSLYQIGTDYLTKVTTQEFFSPKGNKINGVGVTPNIVVDIPAYIVSEDRLFSGDTKEQVKNVEDILKYLGYFNEVPDQTYTASTYWAVRAFQKANGLYSYGVCDFSTQGKLNEVYAAALAKNDFQFEEALAWIEEDMGK